MTDNLKIETAGGVMEIALVRPDKKNALTGDMYEGLVAAMQQADSGDDVRVILIHGEGENFSAGSDIGEFLTRVNRTEEFPALRFIRQLARCETPIVAAVDGNAVGVGTTMLLHCDLIYATPQARFHMPFINLALVPEAASSLLLPARIGHARAAELLMLGESFDAETAVRLGVINAVMPRETLLAHARERAALLASKPRNALRATRRLMRGDTDAILERIDTEAREFDKALRSDEARQVFQAFLARGKN
ncbi:MAG: enoyl-CoA hydratase-related protein [Beijerinckiaceae bacterium]